MKKKKSSPGVKRKKGRLTKVKVVVETIPPLSSKEMSLLPRTGKYLKGKGKKLPNFTCEICFSKYREEIEELIENDTALMDISRAYYNKFQKSVEATFEMIRRHKEEHLDGKNNAIIRRCIGEAMRVLYEEGEMSYEHYEKVALNIGYVNMMEDPKSITPQVITQMERNKITRENAEQGEQKAQEILAKMFSGFIKEKDVKEAKNIIEGEVVDEPEASS